MALIQSGPRNAKLMTVGEAPGAEEERTGRPFVGYAGQLLDDMLSRSNIFRHECFITNVCHVRPPGNDFNWFKKGDGKKHLLAGMLQLKADIESIKPNLVLALGAQPLFVLTGKSGIINWRGSTLESVLVKGQKVLGTYHPAGILRVWEYKAVAEMDLKKAKREMAFPEIRRPRRSLILPPDPQIASTEPDRYIELRRLYVKDATTAAAEMVTAEWLACDIECWLEPSGIWTLACISFSDRTDRSVVITFDDTELAVLTRSLLKSPARKVLQNGTFDVTVLTQAGYELRNFAWDTMLAHHSLYTECASGGDEVTALLGKKRQSALSKGLAFLTTIYTDEPRYKDDRKLWKKTNDLRMFWRYNALDSAVTREIRDGQDADLHNFDTVGIFQHEMSLIEPLLSASSFGIRISQSVRDELRRKYTHEVETLQKFLDLGVGSPVNVESHKQMTELLYGKLGLPKQYNRKTKSITGDKDTLIKLSAKYKHPLLLTILKIREKRTILERYVNAVVDPDDRMRCSFDITGTRTGRISSRESLSGGGTNLQNIPDEMRRMFVADPGKTFIYADYSQAEARIVAYLSRDDYLIDLFNDPTRDIHTETASKIFGKPIDQITPDERYIGKKARHALNYGMEADTFVRSVNAESQATGIYIDASTARRVIDGFFMLHPNHKPIYWGSIKQQLKNTRTLNTPFGRKRVFFGRMDDKLLREAYAYVPQSTVGDLCCAALVRCYHEIQKARPELEANILVSVHDSILMQCKTGAEKDCASLMIECMSIPITLNGYTFTIPVEVKVGTNWMDASGDNPDGLRKPEWGQES